MIYSQLYYDIKMCYEMWMTKFKKQYLYTAVGAYINNIYIKSNLKYTSVNSIVN
jgi:hypothetical protein